MPQYSVGDLVRHHLTGEEGRIVRMLKIPDMRQKETATAPSWELAYVVALPAEPFATVREALWFRSEVNGNGSKPPLGAHPSRKLELCWICGKEVRPRDRKLDELGKPVHVACQRSDSIPVDVGHP